MLENRYDEGNQKVENQNDVLSQAAIINKMASYVEKANRRLELLSEVTKEDILDAMYERGEHNEPMASITFTREVYDRKTLEKKMEITKFTTVNTVADFLEVNGYGTLILYFDKASEAASLLKILDNYGRGMTRPDSNDEELVNGTFAVVPFMLGGKYALVASGPRQWVPLSQNQEPGVLDEIRLYFDPGEFAFICNPDVDAKDTVKEIQSEMIQEKWEFEQREKKAQERREYEAQREAERAEVHRQQHGFTARRIDTYFQN